jgi:hypothetical protein
MGKGMKTVAGAFGAIIVLGVAVFAETGMMVENLTEISDNISSMDMNNNFGDAKTVLDNFFTASFTKNESDSSPVVFQTGTTSKKESPVSSRQNEVKKLSGNVPPLDDSENPKGPLSPSPFWGASLLAGLLLVCRGGKPYDKGNSGQVSTSTGTQNSNQVNTSTNTSGGTSNYDISVSAPTAGAGTTPVVQQNSSQGASQGTGSGGSTVGNPHTPQQYNIDHNLQR